MAGEQPQDWHHENIKAELRKKHGSLEALAIAWGFSRSAVRVALNPGSRWPKLEARIAAELNVAPHILWPDRWNPDGTRRPPSIATDDSPPAKSLHRQIGRAA